MYEEPSKGPIATLQLDLEMLKGVAPSYPKVDHYKYPCVEGSTINGDFEHYYLDGNPPQDLKNNRWKDLVGYKLEANKEVFLRVRDAVHLASNNQPVNRYARCEVSASFVPLEHNKYRLFFTNTEDKCRVDIRRVHGVGSEEVTTIVPNVKYNQFTCE